MYGTSTNKGFSSHHIPLLDRQQQQCRTLSEVLPNSSSSISYYAGIKLQIMQYPVLEAEKLPKPSAGQQFNPSSAPQTGNNNIFHLWFQGQSFQAGIPPSEILWCQNDKFSIQHQRRPKITILTAELVHRQSSPAAIRAAGVRDETRP